MPLTHIPVRIEAEIYQLNRHFQPEKLCVGFTHYYDDFPFNLRDSAKKIIVQDFLAQQQDHLQALYFKAKLFWNKAPYMNEVFFECEDFFERDPQKRICMEWDWDKELRMGISTVRYPDGSVVDPREQSDWQYQRGKRLFELGEL